MKTGEHQSNQSTGARVPAVARRLANTARDAVPALAAGLVASLAATLVMLLLRLTLGSVTLPELVGERILPQLDAGTFVRLLIQFGKVAPLLETLAGQIVLGVLVAPVYPLLARRLASRWPVRAGWLAASALALAEWLVALLLFWPVLAENLSGFPVGAARGWTVVGLALIFAVYAAVLALTYQALVRPAGSAATVGDADAPNPARRALLARSAVAAAGGVVLGGAGLGGLLGAVNARSNLAYEGMTTPAPTEPITPANQFYVVSKNVLDPEVALANWDLEVAGLVRQPGRYTLPALRALPMETRAITLECIANGVDGHLISTAMWRGVTLEALLAAHGGALPGAAHLVFTGADGYVSSLPLADLLAAGTLLTCDMNGAPLPKRHGYPLRAVVPGRFGEQSAKWLTRIELVAAPVKGFYQQQGWYSGPLYTISRIDGPGKHDRLPAGQPVRIHGIAFGGTRGIQRVEVSVDGGVTWRLASFPPPLSSQAWALWHLDWTPTTPGATELIVRATDGTGAPQIATARGTVPNGGTGLHHVPVIVVA
ncbi:MAG TPA: molybdopterin-dependent oxidoreductase [Ktedonobacterales bacterium]|nr:molybdopterin-dependent oxidoreductase [Ktedonobacterales bacterium]